MRVHARGSRRAAVEVVVFPEPSARHRMLIENGALLLVRGKFERDEEIVALPVHRDPAARQPARAAVARRPDPVERRLPA